MLTILIVDDTHQDLILAEKVIRRCKILNPIRLIVTIEECFRHFEEMEISTDENDSCLLFLDMLMPTSGLDFLRALRQRELGEDSIIIILSGTRDMKIIQQTYDLGARAFLAKPITTGGVTEVLASLKTRIRIAEGPDGNVLHWHSTSASNQIRDTDIIQRPGGITTTPPRGVVLLRNETAVRPRACEVKV